MHKAKRERALAGARGSVGKQVVLGVLERTSEKSHSRVRVRHVKDANAKNIQGHVREPPSRDDELITMRRRLEPLLSDAYFLQRGRRPDRSERPAGYGLGRRYNRRWKAIAGHPLVRSKSRTHPAMGRAGFSRPCRRLRRPGH